MDGTEYAPAENDSVKRARVAAEKRTVDRVTNSIRGLRWMVTTK